MAAVVVSPLISLMHDQVLLPLDSKPIYHCTLHSARFIVWQIGSLKKLGVPAAELGTGAATTAALVYTTPEKLMRSETAIRDLMQQRGVSLIAIDEAHCVSEWGQCVPPRSHLVSGCLD